MTAAVAPTAEPRPTREERKYPLPEPKAALLAAWLDARLPRDPQYPEGVITSCYFDSPMLDAYQQSADGEFVKRKLRLRWYGDPPDPYAGVWLELKARDGVRSAKQRIRFPLRGTPNRLGLAIPDRAELSSRLRELGVHDANLLEPIALTRYRRIRWQSSDAALRASLDTDLRAAHPAGAPIWLPVPNGAVLELKSAAELPPQLSQLQRLGLRRTAHSKYALAVERLYGGNRPRAG